MERIDKSRKSRMSKKGKKKKPNWFLRIMVFMIIGIFLFGAYIFYNVWGAFSDTQHDLARGGKSEKREEAVSAKDPVAFLLMGIDEREGRQDVGRPDVLMVVTVNPEDKTAKMLSIPRDTLTYIPAVGKEDKINHSYSLAEIQQSGTGVESTITTVEELLNIPIDYFAKVNFEGFVETVNELGGVDVNVERAFKQNAFDGEPDIYFEEGPAHLNGKEALAYVRMRKEWGGDEGRNKRQREVLTQLMQKASSFTNITKIDDVVESLGRNVNMNVGASELLTFARQYGDIPKDNIETLTLEGTGSNNGTYYYILNEGEAERVGNILREHLNLPTTSTVDSDTEQNDTGA